MPRPRRAAEGGLIYRALNRANARLGIFENDEDYTAFERVLAQAVARYDLRLLAYCVITNHFHLLLWPHDDADRPVLTPWPIDRPRDWAARVNRPFGPKEEQAVRRSIQRGQLFGSASWQADVATRLGLESVFRPRGRPRKKPPNGS